MPLTLSILSFSFHDVYFFSYLRILPFPSISPHCSQSFQYLKCCQNQLWHLPPQFRFFQIMQSTEFDRGFPTIAIDVKQFLTWVLQSINQARAKLVIPTSEKSAKRKMRFKKFTLISGKYGSLSSMSTEQVRMVLRFSLAIRLCVKKDQHVGKFSPAPLQGEASLWWSWTRNVPEPGA